MKENYLEELIDALLKGTITDEDRYSLENMMKADPAIARKVRESRETYNFLQYARYQQIKTQLRKFDEKESLPLEQSPPMRWTFAAAMLLFFMTIFWIGVINYWKPESLAKRYFENISGVELLQGTTKNEDVLQWDLANELFAKDDFQNAASLYMVYSESRYSSLYIKAKWNLLMCQLAIEGPNENWKNDLNTYMLQASKEKRAIGKRLLKLFHSDFYKWTMLHRIDIREGVRPWII